MPPKKARELRGTIKVATEAQIPLAILPTGPINLPTQIQIRETPSGLITPYVPNLTQEQWQLLDQLPFGQQDSIDRNEAIYATIQSLIELGWDVTYDFLRTVPNDNPRFIIFGLPILRKAQEKERIDLEIFRTKIQGTKGAFKCKRCGSVETISAEKQTRSADEPMSIKVTCIACGLNWKAQ